MSFIRKIDLGTATPIKPRIIGNTVGQAISAEAFAAQQDSTNGAPGTNSGLVSVPYPVAPADVEPAPPIQLVTPQLPVLLTQGAPSSAGDGFYPLSPGAVTSSGSSASYTYNYRSVIESPDDPSSAVPVGDTSIQANAPLDLAIKSELFQGDWLWTIRNNADGSQFSITPSQGQVLSYGFWGGVTLSIPTASAEANAAAAPSPLGSILQATGNAADNLTTSINMQYDSWASKPALLYNDITDPEETTRGALLNKELTPYLMAIPMVSGQGELLPAVLPRGAPLVLTEAAENSVWSLPPLQRGVAIENQLASTEYADWYHIGAENNGYFPTIDFQQGQTVVSLKTADTTGFTWLGRTQDAIDELAGSGATVNNQPANLVLDLRVQPGGSYAAQSLINYGNARGVTVVIKEYP